MSNTRLTIFDIAKIAGVSRSTVSRALNNDSGISDETKEKILNVIKEMNYRPNVNARRTVTRRCECLGLYIGSRVLIRDANSRVLSGIIAKCNEVAYDLVLRSSCSTDRLVEMYNEHKVDGFVILNPYPDIAPMLEFLEANNVPYACTAVCSDENKFLYVDTDNRRAAYDAVSYLIGKGHQHIALLTEEPSISASTCAGQDMKHACAHTICRSLKIISCRCRPEGRAWICSRCVVHLRVIHRLQRFSRPRTKRPCVRSIGCAIMVIVCRRIFRS